MIQFLSVEITGFLGVSGPETVRLDEPGLTLVAGKNGAGKSTRYPEAVVWALFGKTVRDVAADDVVKDGAPMARVVLTALDTDLKETFRIERIKPAGKGQILSVWRMDGSAGVEIFPATSVSERQAQLEQWLGVDSNTFLNSVVFGQGAAALFASGQLSDAERKRVFDVICGLDAYDSALEVAQARKRRADAEAQMRSNHLADVRNAITRGHEAVDRLTLRLKEVTASADAEIATTMDALREAQSELNAAGEAQAAAAEAYDRDTAALQAIQNESVDYTELTEMEGYITSLTQDVESRKRARIRAEERAKTTMAEVESLEASMLSRKCPTCGGTMPTATQLTERLATLDATLTSTHEELELLDRQDAEDLPMLSEAQEAVRVLQEARSSRTTRMATAQAAVRSSKMELDSVGSLVRARQNSFNSLARAIEVLKATPNAVRTDVEAAQVELEKAKELEGPAKEAFDKAERALQIADFWVAGFGPKGIKAFVIEGMLPGLNTLINEHLAALSDGELSAEVSATTALKKGGAAERLSVLVRNSSGATSYGGNSGGERRRIDLAILLGLQDLVGSRAKRSINFAVYDEVLDALDDDGISRAVSHLRARSAGRPTYVISHATSSRALIDDIRDVGASRPAPSMRESASEEVNLG